MANEFIHYAKRRILARFPQDVDSPWFWELQTYGDGFDAPRFHVTRSMAWPASAVRPGDVIWLVGQLSSPWGRLAPAVDARIVVADVQSRVPGQDEGGYRFVAGDGSCWFPMFDAVASLERIRIELKNGDQVRLYAGREDNLGQAFRNLRKVSNPEILHGLERQLATRPMAFVSYRVADGTKPAYRTVASLLREGQAVWWDRWSMPRRLAERREVVGDHALDRIQYTNIERAARVLGVETPLYAEPGSYSAAEREYAQRLDKYVAVAPVPCSELVGERP